MYNIKLTQDELITLIMALDAHRDWVLGKIANDFMDMEEEDVEYLERKDKRLKALLDNIHEQEHNQNEEEPNEDKYW